MKVLKNATDLIGSTPLVELNAIKSSTECKARIIGKVEFGNLTHSIKDRIAKQMIEDAIQLGKIDDETLVIEPTSGNTGIGLAAICATKGIKLTIVMPETMSEERRNLIKAFGANLILTPGDEGMKGAIKKALELNEEIENSFIVSQFTNTSNPKAHKNTTGPEIWNDTEGKVDIIIGGVGTGGTISGAGAYLKEKNPAIKVIAVEPAGSPVISQGKSGTHIIQGIGAGFVPDTLDTFIIDEIITVSDDDAASQARNMARKEGLLVGISSGAALQAALEVGARAENVNKTIVVILPDTGERYLSTGIYN